MASERQSGVKSKEKHAGTFSILYLMLYNLFQFVGWTYIFYLTITHLVQKKSYLGLWDSMHQPLKFFQTLALLEVVHSILGFTRSSPVINLLQVSSRLFAVWGIMHSVPEALDSLGVVLLTVAWCIAEITRYLYYALDLVHSCPYILTWCRYTFFMVLYPVGITGEILAMLAAFPYIRQRNLYSISLPNAFNFSFSFSYVIVLILASYIPLSPQLFGHMLIQRKKVLGADKQKAKPS